MKVSGSVGAAVKVTDELLETLEKLIVEENHFPEQIFNVNETTSF